MTAETDHPTNALADATSPYLRQHMHNPVAWREWSDASIDEAKQADKPIFLSVGYSTCHWCHVMAHQSFEDETVAEYLNEHFIPIKVDREERPDIDEQYMLATQLMTQRGGWPNSVFCMPDGRPFFAGTYYPRLQFMQLLKQLADAWAQRRDEVKQQAQAVTRAIRNYAGQLESGGGQAVSREPIEQTLKALENQYDGTRGGFGGAPKFPPHTALALLLHEHDQRGDAMLLSMTTHTLAAMARGGIFDQVGGGFARYSTDNRWLLPHFEKMLYDNGQLLGLFAAAHDAAGEPLFADVIDRTVAWLQREMRDERGGFYSAIDADSEGEEGKYYVWTTDEVKDVLGEDDGELFAELHGFEETGNWVDEASGHRPGTNICHLPQSVEKFAEARGLDAEALREKLPTWYEKLHAVRWQRPHPHLDDKVLTAWNGLMIGGLADAGRLLEREQYVGLASDAAGFVLDELRTDAGLLRTWRDGEASEIAGYLDDYAYFIDGLLRLHEASGEKRWREAAIELTDEMVEQFRDEKRGAFTFSSDRHEDLIMRTLHLGSGGNTPSPNAVAIDVLRRVSHLTGSLKYARLAWAALQALGGALHRMAGHGDALHVAAARFLDDPEMADMITTQGPPKSDRPVTLAGPDETVTIQPGEQTEAVVTLVIGAGFHVFVHDEDETAEVASLSLRFAGTPGIAVAGVALPEPSQQDHPAVAEPLPVYEGRVPMTLTIEAADDAEPGERHLVLQVTAQACDDEKCLPPDTLELALPLHVVAD